VGTSTFQIECAAAEERPWRRRMFISSKETIPGERVLYFRTHCHKRMLLRAAAAGAAAAAGRRGAAPADMASCKDAARDAAPARGPLVSYLHLEHSSSITQELH